MAMLDVSNHPIGVISTASDGFPLPPANSEAGNSFFRVVPSESIPSSPISLSDWSPLSSGKPYARAATFDDITSTTIVRNTNRVVFPFSTPTSATEYSQGPRKGGTYKDVVLFTQTPLYDNPVRNSTAPIDEISNAFCAAKGTVTHWLANDERTLSLAFVVRSPRTEMRGRRAALLKECLGRFSKLLFEDSDCLFSHIDKCLKQRHEASALKSGASSEASRSATPSEALISSSIRISFASSDASVDMESQTGGHHLPLHDELYSSSSISSIAEAFAVYQSIENSIKSLIKKLTANVVLLPCYATISVDLAGVGSLPGKLLSLGIFELPDSVESPATVDPKTAVGHLGRLVTHLAVLHRASVGVTTLIYGDDEDPLASPISSAKAPLVGPLAAPSWAQTAKDMILLDLWTDSDIVDCLVTVDSPFWVGSCNSMLAIAGKSLSECAPRIQMILAARISDAARVVQMHLIELDLDDAPSLWNAASCENWLHVLTICCEHVQTAFTDMLPMTNGTVEEASPSIERFMPAPRQQVAVRDLLGLESASPDVAHPPPSVNPALLLDPPQAAKVTPIILSPSVPFPQEIDVDPPVASQLRFSLSPARQEPLNETPPRPLVILTPSPRASVAFDADGYDAAPPAVLSTASQSPLLNDTAEPIPAPTDDNRTELIDTSTVDTNVVVAALAPTSLTAASSGITLDDDIETPVTVEDSPEPEGNANRDEFDPAASSQSPPSQDLEWENAKLLALIKVLEQQNAATVKQHQDRISELQGELETEKMKNAQLQHDRKQIIASSHAIALQIPLSSSMSVAVSDSDSPLAISSAFLTPRDLRCARKRHQEATSAKSPCDDLSSPVTSTARQGLARSISTTPRHLREDPKTKLQHAQALRRLMVREQESSEFAHLMQDFATASLQLLNSSQEKYKLSVFKALQAKEANALSKHLATAEHALELKFQHFKSLCDEMFEVAPRIEPIPTSMIMEPEISTSHSPDVSALEGDQAVVSESRSEDTVPPRDDLTTQNVPRKMHRLTTHSSARESSEVVQALVLSSRNLRGEQRRAAGEPLPNMRCDAIRKEALQWRQQHLDEYKLFAAHQAFILGDAHTGKTSLIACLSASKPPISLFKKAPSVVTPTLEITRHVMHASVGRAHGVAVPVGGVKGHFGMADVARVCRSGSASSSAQSNLTAPLVLVDVPPPLLRASSPRTLPSRGAVYVIVFRLTDPEDISRQSILQHAQHVLTVASDHSKCAAVLPFVLIGTHADQVPSLCDVRDLTTSQRVLGSFREWLESEFSSLRQDGVANPVVLDVFAVSCSQWTVVGERPKSAEDFPTLASEWAVYLSFHSPTAPDHFLPTVQEVIRELDGDAVALLQRPGSRDSLSGISEAYSALPTERGIGKSPNAPSLVDTFWSRRGGGLSTGSLFPESSSRPSPDSALSAASFETHISRWLYTAAAGVISLFTALRRYSEFTGHLVAMTTLTNIIIQHLQIAPQTDQERELPDELLSARDIIVERFYEECGRRGIICRLTIDSDDAVGMLGYLWHDAVLSSIMLPFTLQIASNMPSSAPSLRQSVANQGPRHIVQLLQRVRNTGLDLASTAMPLELAAYRKGHISRKLLFQLLPAPLNTVAASQLHAEHLLAAVGLCHTAVKLLDDDPMAACVGASPELSRGTSILLCGSGATPNVAASVHETLLALSLTPAAPLIRESLEPPPFSHSSFTSVTPRRTSSLPPLHDSPGGHAEFKRRAEWMPMAPSSLFVPAASSSVHPLIIQFLEEAFALISRHVCCTVIQIEMPFMSLFYRVQSRIFVESSVTAAGHQYFFGNSFRNAFAVTLTQDVWLLLVPLDSQVTFSEYRVIVANHRRTIDDEDEAAVADEVRSHLDYVCQTFSQEIQCFVEHRLPSIDIVDGPTTVTHIVEAWDDTMLRLSRLRAKSLSGEDANSVQSQKGFPSDVQLRSMIERTAPPSLRDLLSIAETIAA